MWVMWKIVAPHITLSKRDAFSKLRVRAVLSEQLLSAPTAKPIAPKKVFGDLRSRVWLAWRAHRCRILPAIDMMTD